MVYPNQSNSYQDKRYLSEKYYSCNDNRPQNQKLWLLRTKLQHMTSATWELTKSIRLVPSSTSNSKVISKFTLGSKPLTVGDRTVNHMIPRVVSTHNRPRPEKQDVIRTTYHPIHTRTHQIQPLDAWHFHQRHSQILGPNWSNIVVALHTTRRDWQYEMAEWSR